LAQRAQALEAEVAELDAILEPVVADTAPSSWPASVSALNARRRVGGQGDRRTAAGMRSRKAPAFRFARFVRNPLAN
jgi:hypothetical protein